MSTDEKMPPELEQLAERIGDFIQYFGFKRIHGKVWAHIATSAKPLDAQALIRRLKVSKALMSFSLNDLLKYDVIHEAGKSERNTQLYVSNPDILAVILNVLRRREKVMLSQISSAFQLVERLPQDEKTSANIDPDHLQKLGTMIQQAEVTLSAMLSLEPIDFERWQEVLK